MCSYWGLGERIEAGATIAVSNNRGAVDRKNETEDKDAVTVKKRSDS